MYKLNSVKYLRLDVGVRRWENSTLNGYDDIDGEMPCRNDDRWCPFIDVDSGKILNWAKGNRAWIHYKVCDDGVYYFVDSSKYLIRKIEMYVPKILALREDDFGYGDYILMNIDANGKIEHWDKKYLKEAFETMSFGEQ